MHACNCAEIRSCRCRCRRGCRTHATRGTIPCRLLGGFRQQVASLLAGFGLRDLKRDAICRHCAHLAACGVVSDVLDMSKSCTRKACLSILRALLWCDLQGLQLAHMCLCCRRSWRRHRWLRTVSSIYEPIRCGIPLVDSLCDRCLTRRSTVQETCFVICPVSKRNTAAWQRVTSTSALPMTDSLTYRDTMFVHCSTWVVFRIGHCTP